MGFYIGVGGVVTFKNAKKLKEVVENIPLTSIVLETDCPYMAPEPNRGKRNNSAYIRYVAEKIAELKGITYEEVVEQTEKNAREMYRLQQKAGEISEKRNIIREMLQDNIPDYKIKQYTGATDKEISEEKSRLF